MSSLVKFEPLRELEHFARRFNSMFKSPFAHDDMFAAMPTVWSEGGNFVPKVDISEDDKQMFIHVELPGMEKDDVKITISEDKILTIKGEKKREEKKEEKNYLRVERSYGSFLRSFSLPDNVQPDDITAAFEKGILHLTLPKTEVKKPQEKVVTVA